MRPLSIVVLFVLLCLNGYGQELISPIKYKAKQTSIPIVNCNTEELIIYVPLHKVLVVNSYRTTSKSYNVQYKGFVGCVHEKWMRDINSSMKNAYTKLYLDSLQQDSIKRDKINKDQIRLGFGPLPKFGDTLICYREVPFLFDDYPHFKENFKLMPGQSVTYVDFVPNNYGILRVSVDTAIGMVRRDWLKSKTEYAVFLIEEAKKIEQRKIYEEQVKAERELARINQEKARIAEEKARAASAQKRKSELISKYGQINGMKVFRGEIFLGMTDKMAKESWGAPDDINRSVGSWGVHEQWVYGDTYLYFENGILTSWQD